LGFLSQRITPYRIGNAHVGTTTKSIRRMAEMGQTAPRALSSNESVRPQIAAATRTFSRFGFAPKAAIAAFDN